MIRPYVRFDWFSGTSPAANLRPFDDGTGNSQTLLGFDVIDVVLVAQAVRVSGHATIRQKANSGVR